MNQKMPRHKKLVAVVFAAALLALLAGCASILVDTDYDSETDFAALRSYRWIEVEPTGDPRVDDGLLRSRVRRAVDTALARKGFTLDEETPDFLVLEHLVFEKELGTSSYAAYYGPSYGARYGGGPSLIDTHTREFDLGTVLVDILDARSKKLVWRGSGQSEVQQNVSPEQRTERIRSIIEQMLAEFPPEQNR